MKRGAFLRVLVLSHLLVLFMYPHGFCDVSPGDVLDKTNWEKAKGLLPEEILEWVKKGEFVLQVGELTYNPRDSQPAFALEALKTNVGKYDLGENHWIVESGTGKPASGIIGIPFPEIDTKDPMVAEKIANNRSYRSYIAGDVQNAFSTDLIRPSGYGRSTKGRMDQMAMVGNPKALARRNPDKVEKYQIFLGTAPYDIAGTAVMTWRYLDPYEQDNTFAYVPAVRRVRRMSPGNRSDALMGSDFAVDDAGGYDGKVTAMEWKFVRSQEALVPFPVSGFSRLEVGEDGAWQSSEHVEEMTYGYEKKGWQGAQWAPVSWIWVKQPMYVLEMKSKDPYYNYGSQDVWFHADTYVVVYKSIRDKSGKHWKTFMEQHRCYESADKGFHLTHVGDQLLVDTRMKHGTVITAATPTDIWTFYGDMKRDTFSLGGFQKFCK